MHSSITAEGVLTAARNIQTALIKLTTSDKTIQANTASIPSSVFSHLDPVMSQDRESMLDVTGRAHGLLQYVESNIESLLKAVDAVGLDRAKEIIKSSHTLVVETEEEGQEETSSSRSSGSTSDSGEEREATKGT